MFELLPGEELVVLYCADGEEDTHAVRLRVEDGRVVCETVMEQGNWHWGEKR